MTSSSNGDKFQQKWWLHQMDPDNLPELSSTDRRNAKRFNHWLLLWGLIFFGVVIGTPMISEAIDISPTVHILIMLSPIIPSGFVVYSFYLLLKAMKDELIKQIYYQSIAIGFAAAFLIGVGFILSESIFGTSTKMGPFMFVSLIAGYFIGLFINSRKYSA